MWIIILIGPIVAIRISPSRNNPGISVMLCGPGRMLASMDHAPRPRPLNRRAPPRCVSFSVRSEPVPVPEEHDRILPRPGHRPLHRPSTVLSPPVHRPFAAVQGVAVQAYRALGQGKNLGHPAVMDVAAESGRTAAQVRGRLDGRVHSHTTNRRACPCECCVCRTSLCGMHHVIKNRRRDLHKKL